MLEALQVVGLLSASYPRPQGEIVCKIDVRVRQWAAWDWLGAPNARRVHAGRLLGLWAVPERTAPFSGKCLELLG
jgi:hypothetical protein